MEGDSGHTTISHLTPQSSFSGPDFGPAVVLFSDPAPGAYGAFTSQKEGGGRGRGKGGGVEGRCGREGREEKGARREE